MANRRAAEQHILTYIAQLTPNEHNAAIYTKLFASMTDEDFDRFISDLETGKRFLVVIVPNFANSGLNVENNLRIADELGHPFFESIWIESKEEELTYLTPIKYLVVDLPLKRASQLLVKKISVPDHNRVVDTLTGQPTGESKGAKISYPELQVCSAMGLDSTMVELMKYRGGDNKGNIALNNMLSKLGRANLKTLSNYASGVESSKTLKTFLTAAHLKSTL